MWDGSVFLGALTPRFYVALTGTSSLISGLILIFEWWYFRKYGTSFIEQMSLAHFGPWLGGAEPEQHSPHHHHPPHPPNDCKVWRNPLALLRGAEYGRLWSTLRRPPLTYYDMNLSAQEHQAWFSIPGATGDPAEEAMARAWRERDQATRVAAARTALAHKPDCAAALLLLAEEDAPTVQEAERVLRKAWRAAEAAWRAAAGAPGAEARRAAAVLAHVKRRCAMCARRLGRLRDAARLFRELARDAPPALHHLQLHENLIEVLLEQKAYADIQAVLARYDDFGLPASACVLYTAALLRARAAPAAPSARHADMLALAAMRRAIEFNPYVPAYLLELRALSLPPEHIVRRGDSEALAYAFWHLPHWKSAENALRLLQVAAYPLVVPHPLRQDTELLVSCGGGVVGSGAGGGWWSSTPPLALPCAGVCAALAACAWLAHRWPQHAPIDPSALLRLLADV